jgi:hypothetical protein
MKRDKIRFSPYKHTIRSSERYIPRSLDVANIIFLYNELKKPCVRHYLFCKFRINQLRQIKAHVIF